MPSIFDDADEFASDAFDDAKDRLDAVMSNMREDANAVYVKAAYKAAARASQVGREQALREAVAEMAGQGVCAYSYVTKDGTQVRVSADAGVRRIINDSMRSRQMDQTLGIAKRLGVNLVEVSTTANARKSHEAWQGKVYSLEGGTEEYPNFYESCHVGDKVRGIGGYNCGHQVSLYYEGHKKVFDDPLEGTGYTTEQVRYLTSRQRYLEREVRKEKRVREVMKKAGFETRETSAKIRQLQLALDELIDSNAAVLRRQAGYREAIAPILRKREGAQGIVHLGKDAVRRASARKAARLSGYEAAKAERDWLSIGELKLNKGNQDKHIKGTNAFARKVKVSQASGYSSPSYLVISVAEAERLAAELAGTGRIIMTRKWKWSNTEVCFAGKVIGYYLTKDGREIPTRYFKLHYGKNGVHLVPAKDEGALFDGF